LKRPIRVVVADDHPLFREGVVTSLRSNPDIEVVGQAENAPVRCGSCGRSCPIWYFWT